MTHSLTSVFLLSLMVLFVTGCSYTPARIHPEPIIEIDGDHRHGHDHDYDYDHGHDDFCPPGQAKKGRC